MLPQHNIPTGLRGNSVTDGQMKANGGTTILHNAFFSCVGFPPSLYTSLALLYKKVLNSLQLQVNIKF